MKYLFLTVILISCSPKPQQSATNTDPYILFGRNVRIATIEQYKEALQECGIVVDFRKVDEVYLKKVNPLLK